jgi:hypothetical protein
MLVFASLLLCAICASCNADRSGPPTPPPVTVTVTPSSAQLFPDGNKEFMAWVENVSSSAVIWQLSQASA